MSNKKRGVMFVFALIIIIYFVPDFKGVHANHIR
jgi:hypothetical protein